MVQKQNIINRNVDNLNLPWKSKENLKNFIINNFKKPVSLYDLSIKLNLSISMIGQQINKFKLRNYICYYPSSNKQIELYNYIKSIYNKDIIQNSWIFINKEIDIYLPDKNLGFEFNGNLWHSNHSKYGRENSYHQEKSLLAQENNIQLIHIFEYEWNDKQNILKSLIKSKIGIFEKKIFARKCEIRKLSYQEYASFCNENHLQGEAEAKVKLGLFYQNKLVQIMSFSLPCFIDKYEWEIIRECSKLGYFVIGGKEKLWSYFVKNYNPSNCISYCDFSKFNGESYLRLGFKKIGLNKPGFVWYDNGQNKIFWYNSYKYKETKGADYLKIYNAGQLVFVWNK